MWKVLGIAARERNIRNQVWQTFEYQAIHVRFLVLFFFITFRECQQASSDMAIRCMFSATSKYRGP